MNYIENEPNEATCDIYYWLTAIEPKSGRTVVFTWYNTEEEANRKGFEILGGGFEVIPLPVKTRALAVQKIKYRRLIEGKNLAEAIKRVKHQQE